MIIKIDALDTLFFRDGKPFTMGEEAWADSVFPSSPAVIYGALRSAYFAEHIDELEKANENDDPTRNLKIKGIFLKISDEIYFPLPMDCVKRKDDDKAEAFVLIPESAEKLISNYPKLDKILTLSESSNDKIENVQNALLSNLSFKEYLDGETNNISYFKIDNYLISEPKIGIARSRETHSSEEGKLYRVDMKRLENERGEKIDIVVDFDGLDLPERGLMKLGGEGKAASYKKYKDKRALSVDFPKFKENSKHFKIVLTTPAIFKNGWLPEWIDEKTLIGEYKGLKLKLLTAAIGKPIHIGGFNIKAREPKPMYKAVPAGSVYYFELVDGNKKEVKEAFHKKAISDIDIYSKQGFGISCIGKF